MKNLKRAERTVIALTALCLFFTAGYFLGRGTAVQVISFDKLAAVSISIPSSTVTVNDTGDSNAAASDAPSAPVSAASASAASSNPVTAEKVNINTASQAKLEELPGIGPVLAQNILNYREKIGSFKSIEQIMDVNGIGEKKFDAMKNMIMIG